MKKLLVFIFVFTFIPLSGFSSAKLAEKYITNKQFAKILSKPGLKAYVISAYAKRGRELLAKGATRDQLKAFGIVTYPEEWVAFQAQLAAATPRERYDLLTHLSLGAGETPLPGVVKGKMPARVVGESLPDWFDRALAEAFASDDLKDSAAEEQVKFEEIQKRFGADMAAIEVFLGEAPLVGLDASDGRKEAMAQARVLDGTEFDAFLKAHIEPQMVRGLDRTDDIVARMLDVANQQTQAQALAEVKRGTYEAEVDAFLKGREGALRDRLVDLMLVNDAPVQNALKSEINCTMNGKDYANAIVAHMAAHDAVDIEGAFRHLYLKDLKQALPATIPAEDRDAAFKEVHGSDADTRAIVRDYTEEALVKEIHERLPAIQGVSLREEDIQVMVNRAAGGSWEIAQAAGLAQALGRTRGHLAPHAEAMAPHMVRGASLDNALRRVLDPVAIARHGNQVEAVVDRMMAGDTRDEAVRAVKTQLFGQDVDAFLKGRADAYRDRVVENMVNLELTPYDALTGVLLPECSIGDDSYGESVARYMRDNSDRPIEHWMKVAHVDRVMMRTFPITLPAVFVNDVTDMLVDSDRERTTITSADAELALVELLEKRLADINGVSLPAPAIRGMVEDVKAGQTWQQVKTNALAEGLRHQGENLKPYADEMAAHMMAGRTREQALTAALERPEVVIPDHGSLAPAMAQAMLADPGLVAQVAFRNRCIELFTKDVNDTMGDRIGDDLKARMVALMVVDHALTQEQALADVLPDDYIFEGQDHRATIAQNMAANLAVSLEDAFRAAHLNHVFGGWTTIGDENAKWLRNECDGKPVAELGMDPLKGMLKAHLVAEGVVIQGIELNEDDIGSMVNTPKDLSHNVFTIMGLRSALIRLHGHLGEEDCGKIARKMAVAGLSLKDGLRSIVEEDAAAYADDAFAEDVLGGASIADALKKRKVAEKVTFLTSLNLNFGDIGDENIAPVIEQYAKDLVDETATLQAIVNDHHRADLHFLEQDLTDAVVAALEVGTPIAETIRKCKQGYVAGVYQDRLVKAWVDEFRDAVVDGEDPRAFVRGKLEADLKVGEKIEETLEAIMGAGTNYLDAVHAARVSYVKDQLPAGMNPADVDGLVEAMIQPEGYKTLDVVALEHFVGQGYPEDVAEQMRDHFLDVHSLEETVHHFGPYRVRQVYPSLSEEEAADLSKYMLDSGVMDLEAGLKGHINDKLVTQGFNNVALREAFAASVLAFVTEGAQPMTLTKAWEVQTYIHEEAGLVLGLQLPDINTRPKGEELAKFMWALKQQDPDADRQTLQKKALAAYVAKDLNIYDLFMMAPPEGQHHRWPIGNILVEKVANLMVQHKETKDAALKRLQDRVGEVTQYIADYHQINWFARPNLQNQRLFAPLMNNDAFNLHPQVPTWIPGHMSNHLAWYFVLNDLEFNREPTAHNRKAMRDNLKKAVASLLFNENTDDVAFFDAPGLEDQERLRRKVKAATIKGYWEKVAEAMFANCLDAAAVGRTLAQARAWMAARVAEDTLLDRFPVLQGGEDPAAAADLKKDFYALFGQAMFLDMDAVSADDRSLMERLFGLYIKRNNPAAAGIGDAKLKRIVKMGIDSHPGDNVWGGIIDMLGVLEGAARARYGETFGIEGDALTKAVDLAVYGGDDHTGLLEEEVLKSHVLKAITSHAVKAAAIVRRAVEDGVALQIAAKELDAINAGLRDVYRQYGVADADLDRVVDQKLYGAADGGPLTDFAVLEDHFFAGAEYRDADGALTPEVKNILTSMSTYRVSKEQAEFIEELSKTAVQRNGWDINADVFAWIAKNQALGTGLEDGLKAYLLSRTEGIYQAQKRFVVDGALENIHGEMDVEEALTYALMEDGRANQAIKKAYEDHLPEGVSWTQELGKRIGRIIIRERDGAVRAIVQEDDFGSEADRKALAKKAVDLGEHHDRAKANLHSEDPFLFVDYEDGKMESYTETLLLNLVNQGRNIAGLVQADFRTEQVLGWLSGLFSRGALRGVNATEEGLRRMIAVNPAWIDDPRGAVDTTNHYNMYYFANGTAPRNVLAYVERTNTAVDENYARNKVEFDRFAGLVSPQKRYKAAVVNPMTGVVIFSGGVRADGNLIDTHPLCTRYSDTLRDLMQNEQRRTQEASGWSLNFGALGPDAHQVIDPLDGDPVTKENLNAKHKTLLDSDLNAEERRLLKNNLYPGQSTIGHLIDGFGNDVTLGRQRKRLDRAFDAMIGATEGEAREGRLRAFRACGDLYGGICLNGRIDALVALENAMFGEAQELSLLSTISKLLHSYVADSIDRVVRTQINTTHAYVGTEVEQGNFLKIVANGLLGLNFPMEDIPHLNTVKVNRLERDVWENLPSKINDSGFSGLSKNSIPLAERNSQCSDARLVDLGFSQEQRRAYKNAYSWSYESMWRRVLDEMTPEKLVPYFQGVIQRKAAGEDGAGGYEISERMLEEYKRNSPLLWSYGGDLYGADNIVRPDVVKAMLFEAGYLDHAGLTGPAAGGGGGGGGPLHEMRREDFQCWPAHKVTLRRGMHTQEIDFGRIDG